MKKATIADICMLEVDFVVHDLIFGLSVRDGVMGGCHFQCIEKFKVPFGADLYNRLKIQW